MMGGCQMEHYSSPASGRGQLEGFVWRTLYFSHIPCMCLQKMSVHHVP